MKSKLTKTTLLLLSVLGVILLLKLRLLLIRQFDPDEFAYLHWAWLMFQGQIPYRDFFFYGTPVFLWPLHLVFFLPVGPMIAIAGRLMMFLVYGFLLLCAFLTAKRLTKNIHTALLTAIILASFPMTFDKTVEIRPDILMMVLFLGSFLFLIRKKYLWAGILCAVNTLMFLKIVVLLPALLPFLFVDTKQLKSTIIRFILGAAIPVVLFVLYLLVSNIMWDAWNSVVNISRLVNNDQWGFPPLTGLLPFELVYVKDGGVSYPWIMNTALVLLSLPGIIILYIKTRKTPSLFLFSILFFMESILLFLLFPRPHMQYFIPLTVIASILSGLTIVEILHFLSQKIKMSFILPVGLSLVSILLLSSFFLQTNDRIREGNLNNEQLQVLADIPGLIKPDETVYDEVGSYVFRPDGYFICCLHYEQFVEKLDKTLWSLKENLIKNKTKFIVLDQKGFAFWTPKPADVDFIITHYLPSAYKKIYTLGSWFQCENGECIQLNVHGRPFTGDPTSAFDIVIAEQYKVKIEPQNLSVTIGNKRYTSGQTEEFSPGTYRFAVPKGVTSFAIQMDR